MLDDGAKFTKWLKWTRTYIGISIQMEIPSDVCMLMLFFYNDVRRFRMLGIAIYRWTSCLLSLLMRLKSFLSWSSPSDLDLCWACSWCCICESMSCICLISSSFCCSSRSLSLRSFCTSMESRFSLLQHINGEINCHTRRLTIMDGKEYLLSLWGCCWAAAALVKRVMQAERNAS